MSPVRRRAASLIVLAALAVALLLIQLVSWPPGGRNQAPASIADRALGATLEPLDRDTVRALELATDTRGLVVTSVSSSGAAERAGVRAGDVVERVGSVPVRSVGDLSSAIGDKPRSLTLTLNRHRHYVIVHLRSWSAGASGSEVSRRSDDQEDPRRRR